MKQHVLLSLFAGYGGSRLSAQFAGLKIKKEYASEVNKSAIAVMKHNHPDIILVGDVRNDSMCKLFRHTIFHIKSFNSKIIFS